MDFVTEGKNIALYFPGCGNREIGFQSEPSAKGPKTQVLETAR